MTFRSLKAKKAQPNDQMTSDSVNEKAYQDVKVNNCVLSYTETSSRADSITGLTNYRDDVAISLNKLIRVEVEHRQPSPPKTEEKDEEGLHTITTTVSFGEMWNVDVYGSAIVKSTKTVPGVAEGSSTTNQYPIVVISFGLHSSTDESDANRLKKALDHAGELCKQQPEPF